MRVCALDMRVFAFESAVFAWDLGVLALERACLRQRRGWWRQRLAEDTGHNRGVVAFKLEPGPAPEAVYQTRSKGPRRTAQRTRRPAAERVQGEPAGQDHE